MRTAHVLYKDAEAGLLIQLEDGSFIFKYHTAWLADSNKPSICLTLPKSKQEHQSKFLFPFFYSMLPEGTNKQLVCQHNRIDTDDDFGLLMISAKYDNIGAVTLVKYKES